MSDYISTNRKLWNAKTAYHLNSSFYDVEAFKKGISSLNDIELKLLPESLKDKKVLHLQCHFGQDSISLARMGAKVTAVDFSDEAIKVARDLTASCEENVTFICCDLYDLTNKLDDSFDYVFTSYGTIPWLPDVNKWAKLIKHYLAENGQLIFVEFHPMVWVFDDNFLELKYDYFNTGEIIEVEEGTYADKEAAIKAESITWNHPLSEVFRVLLDNGMQIDHFDEYDYSPYPCFNNVVKRDERQFQIKGLEGKLPMVYSIVAHK